mmetsp:Transcript_5051/g.14527  ORF Transcript_5051/g.14527 Transcript_5051/m.14527 type:complete len:265 (-) Transcript_5051:450-1244(-)|eukprot:CAMPEP_0206142616 /NCGR_PEP_ID=MMETSP1473-20131121/17595_1 /ASSEMBLY_ACC=CAM_ASM_001109 /TAXON_ID=1461547 /ORGANISM="Stichococcus sp, Strain RCC1054" /LENGTH=264 /DNA_ID=CAMNT_0053537673 /DNA_START=235 /DNA_END=1029 /DNA_ORIENTATION=-
MSPGVGSCQQILGQVSLYPIATSPRAHRRSLQCTAVLRGISRETSLPAVSVVLRYASSGWMSCDLSTVQRALVRCATSQYDPLGLPQLCEDIRDGYMELCAQNKGRSAAAALTKVVAAAIAAFDAGYSMERLRLELEYTSQASKGSSTGPRLTSAELQYRVMWLDAVYITLQLVASLQGGEVAAAAVRPLRPWQEEDRPLISIIRQTLHALAAGDPNFVTFDRSLATGGASGGVAADARTVAPQFIPVSQLIMLTLKLLNEQQP